MVVGCDTSFLISLYGNDTHSARAVEWTGKSLHAITLSPYNAYELGSAVRFAAFRKLIRPEEVAMFLAQFDAAVTQGRLVRPACNLADVLDVATRLSHTHTLTGGHRGFDILHMAAALVLEADQFLTFDERQRQLAAAEGLVLPI